MSLRICINGVDNFIGRSLLARLESEAWAEPLGVTGGDDAGLLRALPGVDAIAHCMVGGADRVRRGATVLYDAVRKQERRPRVVHLGSMTVYGSATGRVDESGPLLADLGAYSQSQRDAELIARTCDDVVILRSGAEYGPDCPHWSGRIARLLKTHRLGDLGSAGDGLCNLTYIDDLTTAIVRSLQQPGLAGRTFNVALNHHPTWNDYFTGFSKALGAVPLRRISARRLGVERRLATPLKVMELMAHTLGVRHCPTPPPLTPSLLQVCGQEIQLDVRAAEQALAVHWTAFDTALETSAAHYR